MATCSICSVGGETAEIVNRMLDERVNLDAIAAATGIHRSSIFRHKSKCFTIWRAARLRARNRRNDAPTRFLVEWEPNVLTSFSGDDDAVGTVKARDIVFSVRYQPCADALTAGNPRALLLDDENLESFLQAARDEDAERTAAKLAEPSSDQCASPR